MEIQNGDQKDPIRERKGVGSGADEGIMGMAAESIMIEVGGRRDRQIVFPCNGRGQKVVGVHDVLVNPHHQHDLPHLKSGILN